MIGICEELRKLIDQEKNDLIQNQIEFYLFLTQTAFQIAANDNKERNKVLAGCLKGVIKSLSSMSVDFNTELLKSLYEGACLFYKKYNLSKKRRQYEVYYLVEMMQWEIISNLKNGKGKRYNEIIILIESFYQETVKCSKNWQDHYLWIQMMGKIISYKPLITKINLGWIVDELYFEKDKLDEIWMEYKKSGFLIQSNHDSNLAVVLLDRLQNNKTLQNDRLRIGSFFKKWEDLIKLKEFLMNEQKENVPYSFGSYLKTTFKVERKETDILKIDKIKNFLSFIIPKQLMNLNQKAQQNLSSYHSECKNIRNLLKFRNIINQIQYRGIFSKPSTNLKIFSAQSNKSKQEILTPKLQQMNSFNYSNLKYMLQQSIEENQNMERETNTLENLGTENESLQEQIMRIQKFLNTFDLKEIKLKFINDIQQMLIKIPKIQESNFIKQAQLTIKLIKDFLKYSKEKETQSLQNYNLVVECFVSQINSLYSYYGQINNELQTQFQDFFLVLQEVYIILEEIESVSQPLDLDKIKQQFYNIQLIKFVQQSKFKLQQLNFKLFNFKESLKILIASTHSEQIHTLQNVIQIDQFLVDAIKNYPQKILSCNNNRLEHLSLQKVNIQMSLKDIKSKFSKQKRIIEYQLFQSNLQLQMINSEISDLQIIENYFKELFEVEFSSTQFRIRINEVLDNVPIENSIKKLDDGNFDNIQSKIEQNIYQNFLAELRKLNDLKETQQINQLIKHTNDAVIILKKLEKSINQNSYKLLLSEGLRDLREEIEEYKMQFIQNETKIQQIGQKYQQAETNDLDQEIYLQQIQSDNAIKRFEIFCQNKDESFIQFLMKVLKIQNIKITRQKQILKKLHTEYNQFCEIVQEKSTSAKEKSLVTFNSFAQTQFQILKQLQWTCIDLKQLKNEYFQAYLDRITENLEQEIKMKIEEKFAVTQGQPKSDIQDFLNQLRTEVQERIHSTPKSSKIQVQYEFTISQLQKINLLIIEEFEEGFNQKLGLLDNCVKFYKDFQSNQRWKIKQGLVFTILQISSNCFQDTTITFCSKVLVQLWTQEKDQRVRHLLKNQSLISLQMQILQRDWKAQQSRIEGEMQQMLRKIDDLQEQIFNEANLSKRSYQFIELDKATLQLEEYMNNINEMGQQLKLITDFVNHLRKGLNRVEGKINEMKQKLNSMDCDIKSLRGKSVQQLLEIRKQKVFKEAAQKNVKSIYIPQKTQKKGSETSSNLINFEEINDREGEVNEFLLKGRQTVLLIHGIAGSGKSTTAKKIEEFVWKQYGKNHFNQTLIPIYISLPSLKTPEFYAVEEALHQDEYGFDELQLKECKEMLEKREFRFLLIMDSYDEMKLENIQKNLYHTNKLNQNWSNPLVIFTTRSEILQSTTYQDWFAPEDKTKLKEINLLKFDIEQKKQYLEKFTFLNIKLLIFEMYEQFYQHLNEGQIDIEYFENIWEKLKTQIFKQYLSNLSSKLLLNTEQIESIISFLKNEGFFGILKNEIIKNFEISLQKLWSAEEYENVMRTANLDYFIETPYMMEIIVQVLPNMSAKATETQNLKQNFIKNFSKTICDFLRGEYLITMYAQQKKYIRQQQIEIEQGITLMDIQNLENINYKQVSLEIWCKMMENQVLILFSFDQDLNQFKNKLLIIFEQVNLHDLCLQGKVVKKFEFQQIKIVELIIDALTEQNLSSFDFYDEFIRQYHIKQITKLKNIGKSINVDRSLHDLQQYQIKLARTMSGKQLTQVQHKQKGLLYKDQNEEDEWLSEFFNDDGAEGAYKKDIKSCALIQQKGSNYQFVHKSIQEFLIAAQTYNLLIQCNNIDWQIFESTGEIFLKTQKSQDFASYLSYIQQMNNYEIFNQINKNNVKQLVQLIKIVKDHDLNTINYSTEIYKNTRKYLIEKIQKDPKVIEFLKFLVKLTAVDKYLIQSGSNALNLLVEMKVDLTKQFFKNIKISNTNISGANFSKCNLNYSEFDNVSINGINLNQSLMIDCQWKNLRLNELYQLNGHNGTIASVIFSSDGNTLVSGSGDNSIRFWDVKTGEQKLQLDGHSYFVFSVCFSPDDTQLASGSWDSSIRLWDIQTGMQIQQLEDIKIMSFLYATLLMVHYQLQVVSIIGFAYGI